MVDRLLTKGKSEEELQQRILAAEAQINELKTRLNESTNNKKTVENENTVSSVFCFQQFYCNSTTTVVIEQGQTDTRK